MDENITFYANGRHAPSKEMISMLCQKIPRPFNELGSENLEVYPLTANSGYVVRKLEYDKNDRIKVKEVVTKIWKKSNDQWKIVHLHSTVKEVPIDQ